MESRTNSTHPTSGPAGYHPIRKRNSGPCAQTLLLTGPGLSNRECHWIAPVLLAAVQHSTPPGMTTGPLWPLKTEFKKVVKTWLRQRDLDSLLTRFVLVFQTDVAELASPFTLPCLVCLCVLCQFNFCTPPSMMDGVTAVKR